MLMSLTWLDDICIGNSSNGVIKVTNVTMLNEEENFEITILLNVKYLLLVLEYQTKRFIVMNDIVMFDQR